MRLARCSEMTEALLSLGIDVSNRRRLDLVWIDGSQRIVGSSRRVTIDGLAALLSDLRPDIVAIDSPPAWAPEGARRQTELELWRRGLQLFPTPSETGRSSKGADAWMEIGMAVFKAAGVAGYPLYAGDCFQRTSIEVFPHGSAVILQGHLPPPGCGLKHPRAKAAWRASVLGGLIVGVERLETLDQIDAALAALTGLYALRGEACWRGEPSEGVIVLPCRPERLAGRYRRKEQTN